LRQGVITKKKPLIAIVDDDESVCRALKRLIRSLGMDADTYSSGERFIELIEAMPSLKIDCVVLDVQMPGITGLQVQEQLRRASHRIPIIFITAHDDSTLREQALAAGALAFLRKPFNDELLIKILKVALDSDGHE
jgi:FixJ family two-component response regulator